MTNPSEDIMARLGVAIIGFFVVLNGFSAIEASQSHSDSGNLSHILNSEVSNLSHSSRGAEIKCGAHLFILFLDFTSPPGPETEEDWEPGIVQQDDSDLPEENESGFGGCFALAGLWNDAIAPPPDRVPRAAISLA
jgi:hypothetical protein